MSWSSPDAAQVVPLVARLRDAGLEVWDYGEDMGVGNIHGQILNAIDQVRVGIVCFSDATADRPWITTEADWLFQTWYRNTELQQIIPLWVGPHPKNRIPKILADNNFHVEDISQGGEAALTSLVLKVFRALGREAPIVIPAALFAMTQKQCTTLLAKKGTAATLAAVCQAAGMNPPPPIPQALCQRYGAKADDLAPFAATTPLREVMEGVVRSANRLRAAARPPKRPVWLRWMHEDLIAGNQDSRRQWAAGSSLLIVDSVSAYHPTIQNQLANLPEPKQPERAAILWLPPYTQHTAALESVLAPAAGVVPRLLDAFNDWRDESLMRATMFDTSTLAATKRWLRDALLGVEDTDPVVNKVASMEQATPSRFRLSDALQPAKGRAK